uniref:C2H2-type domain-containing protein n=1 Tax=Oncorhynchus tshawytscha TaxID=74940 RepID=A0AAZ3P2N4_ONCTS
MRSLSYSPPDREERTMTQHTSRLCKGYFTKKESDGVLHQLTWPSQSPNLHPSEMVRDELDHRVKEKQPKSAQHMWELLQDCWKSIPGEEPDSHSDSGKSPSGEPGPETPKPARQHHCSHCENSFCWIGNLKLHERTRTGEKPFQCSQCGKSFAVLANLKRHKRLHTGEKPYHCSQCGMSFNQDRDLKAHEETHRRKAFPMFPVWKEFYHVN